MNFIANFITKPIYYFYRIKFFVESCFKHLFYKNSIVFNSEEFSLKKNSSYNKVALLVVYAPKSWVLYTTYLKFLKGLGFDVAIVINGTCSDKFLELFKNECSFIAYRNNHGRDFGAYKDFFGFIEKNNITINRLILCNDSIFAGLNGEDNRFKEFILKTENDDFAGVAEYMGKPDYHVQSYFLIFSDKVIKNERFLSFWKNFKISEDRRTNIHKGEVKLTQEILKAGFLPKVYLSLDNLKKDLNENDNFKDIVKNLENNEHIHLVFPNILKNLDKNINRYEKYHYDFNVINDNLKVKKILDNKTSIDSLFEFNTFENGKIKNNMINSLADLIKVNGTIVTMPTSSIHLLGFPFLKRDLIYRNVMKFTNIREELEGIDETIIDAYVEDQRTRKLFIHLKFVDRILYNNGVI